jgi:nucleotide-binding universal stress UspA family protein
MGKRVLVALDDSIRATGVLNVAAEFAEKLDADLYVVRSLELPKELALSASSTSPAIEALVPRLRDLAREDLRALAARQPKVRVKELIVELGQPAQIIVAAADRIGADLIVVGSHGYRGWDRVLGTTAASIANLATRNVLIVHDQGREAGR